MDTPIAFGYSLLSLLLSFTKRYTKIMANKKRGIAIIEKRLALKRAADSGVAKRAEPSKRIKSPNKRNAAIKAAIRFIFFM